MNLLIAAVVFSLVRRRRHWNCTEPDILSSSAGISKCDVTNHSKNWSIQSIKTFNWSRFDMEPTAMDSEIRWLRNQLWIGAAKRNICSTTPNRSSGNPKRRMTAEKPKETEEKSTFSKCRRQIQINHRFQWPPVELELDFNSMGQLFPCGNRKSWSRFGCVWTTAEWWELTD